MKEADERQAMDIGFSDVVRRLAPAEYPGRVGAFGQDMGQSCGMGIVADAVAEGRELSDVCKDAGFVEAKLSGSFGKGGGEKVFFL